MLLSALLPLDRLPAALVLRVGLNAAPLAAPLTGIGNYIVQLGAALQESGDVDLYSYDGGAWHRNRPRTPHDSTGRALKRRVRNAIKPWIPFKRALRQSWQQVPFQRGIRRHAIDVYHEPNYVPFRTDVPIVTTIHDLSWLRFAETHPPDRVRWLERAMPRVVREVAAIIVDSDFTREEVLSVFGCNPRRVHTVHLGVARRFHPHSPAETSRTLAPLGLRHGGYVLTLGTIEPRKNIRHAVEAHAALPAPVRARFPLVVAGAPGWRGAGLEGELRARQAAAELRFLGHVVDDDLACLYAGAAVFVFPSLYEGFGLPPLEAMASGVPVVTSNRASMPEVAGGGATLLDPERPDMTAETLASLLDDQNARAELALRGFQRAGHFTWEAAARRTIEVYDAAIKLRQP